MVGKIQEAGEGMKAGDSSGETAESPGAQAIAGLAAQFDRYLARLADEVQAYPDSASLWRTLPGISNSGGTLALHLAGNLQHWIGACLGGNGYVRDRSAEFGERGTPRHEILVRIERARETTVSVLSELDARALGVTFPDLPDHYAGQSTAWFLGHLLAHLGYHLGQLNYHRRVVTGDRD